MGDRCYLEITLRRSDLDRFGKHLDAAPGEEWWDHLDEEATQPGIVTASVYEANYAWYDERMNAAKGTVLRAACRCHALQGSAYWHPAQANDWSQG